MVQKPGFNLTYNEARKEVVVAYDGGADMDFDEEVLGIAQGLGGSCTGSGCLMAVPMTRDIQLQFTVTAKAELFVAQLRRLTETLH